MSLVEIKRQPWFPLREDVTANDTYLTTFEHDNSSYTDIMKEFTDAAQREFSDSASGRTGVKLGAGSLSQDIISPVLAFWGKNAENKTGGYRVYGRRRGGGPIEEVAGGILTLGAQLITKAPTGAKVAEIAYWVDTITNTISWIKPVTPVNSGNDTKCYLAFNGFGLMDIAVMMQLDEGSGSDTTELNCILTGA